MTTISKINVFFNPFLSNFFSFLFIFYVKKKVKTPIFLFKIDLFNEFYVLKYRLILLKYNFLLSILSFFIALNFAY